MKKGVNYLLTYMVISLFLSMSCSNESDIDENPLPTSPPFIKSMTNSCFYNSTVIIVGNNFSPNKENNVIKFGDIKAKITRATKDSLYTVTPNLGLTTTAVDVTVTTFDKTSSTMSIDVDVDQNKVATYDWTTHMVKPGIVYKSGQFSLFGSAQRRIYLLDVTLNESNTLGIGFSEKNATTTGMCKKYDAIAGINAGYFPMSGSSNKDPYIRINGSTVQSGHEVTSAIFTNSALIIHKNVAKVIKLKEFATNLNQIAATRYPAASAENMIVCGPILISEGILENQNMTKSHNTSKTARTGLGVTADGKRVFMVVVDSKGGFTGVTTPELAKILQALGAVNAMNFDGGGSSTMFVENQGDNGRVNFPYGGTTQRAVRSVIYVK